MTAIELTDGETGLTGEGTGTGFQLGLYSSGDSVGITLAAEQALQLSAALAEWAASQIALARGALDGRATDPGMVMISRETQDAITRARRILR